MEEDGPLFEDAVRLSVNKNLADIKTLLGWAVDAKSITEKLKHVRQAKEFLAEIEANLGRLPR